MVETYTHLLREIRALIEPHPTGAAPPLERVEHALTDGYALALALEGERSRLRQEIGELAGAPLRADDGRLQQLVRLSERLGGAESDLGRLRAVLAQLRGRASELRATAAA